MSKPRTSTSSVLPERQGKINYNNPTLENVGHFKVRGKIKNITIDKIKYIAHELAIQTMSWDEPNPDFETRYPNVLESCITTPFQMFSKKLLYKGLVGKGAILFYLLIKNHPFQNGNKRIAVTTLLIFLYLNKKWLKSTEVELYNLAKWVAQSPPEAKQEVVNYIEKFIKKRLVIFRKEKL